MFLSINNADILGKEISTTHPLGWPDSNINLHQHDVSYQRTQTFPPRQKRLHGFRILKLIRLGYLRHKRFTYHLFGRGHRTRFGPHRWHYSIVCSIPGWFKFAQQKKNARFDYIVWLRKKEVRDCNYWEGLELQLEFRDILDYWREMKFAEAKFPSQEPECVYDRAVEISDKAKVCQKSEHKTPHAFVKSSERRGSAFHLGGMIWEPRASEGKSREGRTGRMRFQRMMKGGTLLEVRFSDMHPAVQQFQEGHRMCR
jgi:hypothetical protein